MEKKKDLIWLPIELVERLKEVEDNDAAMETEVIKYVDKTKLDISRQVELLDDDILQFKAKLSLYKKAFKEAYESADTEMYSFWEDLDKKISERHTSLRDRSERMSNVLNSELDSQKGKIDAIYSKMESLNTFKFEKIIDFLKQFNSLDDETKELFKGMLDKTS